MARAFLREQQQPTVVGGARRPAGVREQDEGEQAGDVRVLRQQPTQHPGQVDRALDQVRQGRSRWDGDEIREGITLVRQALRRRPPGRFALQAAIAAVHAEAPSWDETDWREIVALYGVLLQVWPSPVVALNRAVAVGMADGPAAGLAALHALRDEPALAAYGYAAAARADFLRRLGDLPAARLAYEEALHLTVNEVEREFLQSRLASL